MLWRVHICVYVRSLCGHDFCEIMKVPSYESLVDIYSVNIECCVC